VTWTGNAGLGRFALPAYSRAHDIVASGKPVISGSSDPSVRGDPSRWNREKRLLASLSARHQLWYLGPCAEAGVVVLAYEDRAEGWMVEEASGAGQFTRVLLKPRVVLASESCLETAHAPHHAAGQKWFIARSVNFPIDHEPSLVLAE